MHTAETGEVLLGGLEIVVEVARYADDRAPVVNVLYIDAEESRSTNLSVDEAVQLHRALGRALDLLGGDLG